MYIQLRTLKKIKEWGLLQLYEHIGENIDGNAYANMLLNKYKTKSRTLKYVPLEIFQ